MSTIDSVELILVATNQCRFVPYIPLTLQHISAAAGIGERIRCVVMEMLKGKRCAGEVCWASSRHVSGMQNSGALCSREEQQLWSGGLTTPRVGLKPIPVLTPDGCVDR